MSCRFDSEPNYLYKDIPMNSDAKTFIISILRVVLPILFVISLGAFISIPYSLGYHPGETAIQVNASNRHMT